VPSSEGSARLLEEFADLHRGDVLDMAAELLRVHSACAPMRWLLVPFMYTLERRRNFFRTAFSVAAAETVGRVEEGLVAAAAGEIGWTCALIIDDLIDRSPEREGHPATHVVYGRLRACISAVLALVIVVWSSLMTNRVSRSSRLCMTRFGIRLVLASIASEWSLRRIPDSTACYTWYARNVNSGTHWALLGPLVSRADRSTLAAAYAYADATSINGKLRNDLLDYCGGSTESDTRFKDFDRRAVTFPVLMMLSQPLSEDDRILVERHFYERGPSDLSSERFVALLHDSGTFDRYLERMQSYAADAEKATVLIGEGHDNSEPLIGLMGRWTQCIIEVATTAVGRSNDEIKESAA
jgi:geranylgeranyl pyrophosphate synthase